MSHSKNTFKRIDSFIKRQMVKWNAPGTAIGIVNNNGTIYSKGYGLNHSRRNLTIETNTPFCIGSTSKAFTTTALSMLVEEGSIDWDTPVREYMPDFRLYDDNMTNLITPRDLVTHVSGLPRHDAVWFGSSENREAIMKRLRYLKPNKTLRQAYQYNNLMYMAAGILISRVTDLSWESFVRERIFSPLQMSDTDISFGERINSKNRAYGHILNRNRPVPVKWKNVSAIAPAGSITSTADDMSKWLRYNLTAGGKGLPKLLTKKSLKKLVTPIVAVPDSDTYEELFYSSYALGWNVRAYRGQKLIAHSGLLNGFSTHASFLPGKGYGIIVLTNLGLCPLPYIATYRIIDYLLELRPIDWSKRFAEEKSKAKADDKKEKTTLRKRQVKGTRPSHHLKEYCGTYINKGYGKIIVEKKGKALYSEFNSVTSKWRHHHYNQFILREDLYEDEYLVSFRLSDSGKVTGLEIPYESQTEPIEFKKEE